jgi:hypothetical protein
MPFKPGDATRFTKKAKSPRRKRQFSKVANKMLASGASEGSAIRAANAAVAKSTHGGGRGGKDMQSYAARRNRKIRAEKSGY